MSTKENLLRNFLSLPLTFEFHMTFLIPVWKIHCHVQNFVYFFFFYFFLWKCRRFCEICEFCWINKQIIKGMKNTLSHNMVIIFFFFFQWKTFYINGNFWCNINLCWWLKKILFTTAFKRYNKKLNKIALKT